MKFLKMTILLMLALGAQSTLAHHSVAANFDRDATVEVSGTLVEFLLRNPHTHFEVDVTEADGSVSRWLIEWGTKNDLIRRGVDVDKINLGEEVTVTMMLSRTLERVGYARSLILSDGTIIQDCGFTAFRNALQNGEEVQCEPPER
mgnify:CR=1 FL=1|jgi:hypothetical protein